MGHAGVVNFGMSISLPHWLRALLFIEDQMLDFPFVASEVAQLHKLTQTPGGACLDDPTWEGMLLDDYLASLKPGSSIFGQQKLYQRLRQGVGGAQRAAQAGRVQALVRDPATLQASERDCMLLRQADREVAGVLFSGEECPPQPFWASMAWAVGPLTMFSSLATFISPWAWLPAVGGMLLLVVAQIHFHRDVTAWKRIIGTLHLMLVVTSKLGGTAANQALAFNRAIRRMASWQYAIPQFENYSDVFLMGNVRHYFRSTQFVYAQRAYLRDCYELCAELDADMALARHLLVKPGLCWAQAGHGDVLQLDGVTHPLMTDAQPLSITLRDKGAFISGRNGVGKSTLLRTVGMNVIAARAFGFCYASNAQVPELLVCASMQSEDSLLSGESLYMAELRHAHDMLMRAHGQHRCLYLIDEIFRGTNHLESVSGAAAVLDELTRHGWVIVSSHNLVLATLLGHRLEPLFVEPLGGRLQLRPGVLQQTNGLTLLAERGFGPSIEANAAKVYDWLAEYLAHPSHGGEVLDKTAS